MTVAVSVVAYRNPDDIAGLLAALARQSDQDMAIHICENGGAAAFDALQRILEPALGPLIDVPAPDSETLRTVSGRLSTGVPVCLHLAAANLGYAGGVNLCLRQLSGPAWSAVWVINPDARPLSGALSALRGHQQRHGLGIVGGRLVFAEGGKVQAYGGKWRSWMARGLNLGFGADASETPDAAAVEAQMDYVSGACMLISRAFIETIGPMREDYFLYCEEVDWCLRRGHFRLGFAPDAIIVHGHGSTIGSHRDRAKRSRLSVYLDERNKLLLTRRIYPLRFPAVAVITFALLSQYLAHGAFQNYRHALSGWWAGIRGRTGSPPWFTA